MLEKQKQNQKRKKQRAWTELDEFIVGCQRSVPARNSRSISMILRWVLFLSGRLKSPAFLFSSLLAATGMLGRFLTFAGLFNDPTDDKDSSEKLFARAIS